MEYDGCMWGLGILFLEKTGFVFLTWLVGDRVVEWIDVPLFLNILQFVLFLALFTFVEGEGIKNSLVSMYHPENIELQQS